MQLKIEEYPNRSERIKIILRDKVLGPRYYNKPGVAGVRERWEGRQAVSLESCSPHVSQCYDYSIKGRSDCARSVTDGIPEE